MRRSEKAIAKDQSSRPTFRSAAIGFWKMPKLCRAPMPIVRMTAPQITGTQKLRAGSGASELVLIRLLSSVAAERRVDVRRRATPGQSAPTRVTYALAGLLRLLHPDGGGHRPASSSWWARPPAI